MSSFPLHEAAREGKVLIVKGLVAESPKSVLVKDDDGRIPLHWAVSFSQLEIVTLLLYPWRSSPEHPKPFEIDLDDFTDDAGWTPLHIAASVGNVQILDLLLSYDPQPDVNLPTSTGLRPIHLAVAKKHIEVVKKLVESYGASLRLKDKKGQYPIHRAASVGSSALVQYLATKGSNVNVQDSDGWTALHHALAEGFGDIAVLLVNKFDADANVEDSDGKKAVDVAVDLNVKSFFLRETAAHGV
jgi:26S proteasome non-ATPase regulatory subunit 10